MSNANVSHMNRLNPLLRAIGYGVAIPCLLLAVHSARGIPIVTATVTDLSGSFQYDFTIENPGPDDIGIVSISNAPLGDLLIDATLTSPAGFLASYDSGLGIVDFLEDTVSFFAGTTVSGFSFQSLSGSSRNFSTFEAFTVAGDLVFGSVASIEDQPPGEPLPTPGNRHRAHHFAAFHCRDPRDASDTERSFSSTNPKPQPLTGSI